MLYTDVVLTRVCKQKVPAFLTHELRTSFPHLPRCQFVIVSNNQAMTWKNNRKASIQHLTTVLPLCSKRPLSSLSYFHKSSTSCVPGLDNYLSEELHIDLKYALRHHLRLEGCIALRPCPLSLCPYKHPEETTSPTKAPPTPPLNSATLTSKSNSSVLSHIPPARL